ncbi:hypothetical protein G3N56_12705 [Desulfovibrio sulfodismutans]|uniref:Uncharacterized protein n=1 Tax=Desulfolutivibrio sulfodismutans TaxID=63561 RepID=A0A7K3NN21_9BACT|nr:hypothetical protein [Desulfolutivibrio sulfodismutans]NDY57592.1 hypothetical protein [Desulfolutivibrio sulfodismutans]QLA11115.1 hypothetical protein GD606_01905 [Desulfolutivibrio sulfodismutans DSM 3696]
MNAAFRGVSSGPGRFTAPLMALAGVVLCVAQALGYAEILCVTEGCALHENTTVFGLSLWWWGAAAFAGLGVLALMGRAGLASRAGLLCLAADIGLLALMALTAPCLTCLVAGALFLAFYLCATPREGVFRRLPLAIILAWALAFSPNLFAVGKEAMQPWPLVGPQAAAVRLFFSPTCPACRDAVAVMSRLDKPFLGFFPIAGTEEEVRMVARTVNGLEAGLSLPEALARSGDGEPVEVGLLLRFRLLKNKVAYLGGRPDGVPHLQINGWPRKWDSVDVF